LLCLSTKSSYLAQLSACGIVNIPDGVFSFGYRFGQIQVVVLYQVCGIGQGGTNPFVEIVLIRKQCRDMRENYERNRKVEYFEVYISNLS
jgi:hypothetical protein